MSEQTPPHLSPDPDGPTQWDDEVWAPPSKRAGEVTVSPERCRLSDSLKGVSWAASPSRSVRTVVAWETEETQELQGRR